MNDIKNIIWTIRIKNSNRILHTKLLNKLSYLFQQCNDNEFYQTYHVHINSKVKFNGSFHIKYVLNHNKPPSIWYK